MMCIVWAISALFVGIAIGIYATLALLNFGQRTGRIKGP